MLLVGRLRDQMVQKQAKAFILLRGRAIAHTKGLHLNEIGAEANKGGVGKEYVHDLVQIQGFPALIHSIVR